MVCRDIIREDGRDINGNPASRLEYALTFTPYCKQIFEILIPFVGIVMGILCIRMPEIIRRGGNNKVDAPVRNTGEDRQCIPADNLVCESGYVGGSIGEEWFFRLFRSLPNPGFPFLSRTFSCFIPVFPGTHYHT